MLPVLREELALYKGPNAANGGPTWSLHDPVRNLFFRIDWITFEILSRWTLSEPSAIVSDIEQHTAIQAMEEDVESVVHFLAENELVQVSGSEATKRYCEQVDKRHSSWWKWLLHHYLFFRVPLWQPDRWLQRNVTRVAPLFSKHFLLSTLCALFGGLFFVSRQWDSFVSTIVDTFSWQAIVAYFITLIGVKIFHELGHAFTAKRYGCKVPTMGVAFLVLFPMAYTDVNEVWKLPDKQQRLAVGAAGIITELSIAAWATLAWALLPDGYLRDGAFLLATTTWISTIVINASPFLRFDGYFLLMDWLDMPNLHQRSFALARWQIREWLFALSEPRPEYLPEKRHRAVLLFAFLVWLYRLFVFVGIAVLVYFFFPKPLGPFLAVVEITWFIVLPIWAELKEWGKRIPLISQSPRRFYLLAILVLAVCFVMLPWDRRIHSQGVLRPAEYFSVVAPNSARLNRILVGDGEVVEAGQLLIALETPDLDLLRETVASRAAVLHWKAQAAGVDAELREHQSVIQAAQQRVNAELVGVQDEEMRYQLLAPFAGYFYLQNPDLAAGDWLQKNENLAVVANVDRWLVETYLPESELRRIERGDTAWFYSETPGVERLPLQIEHIDRDATHFLKGSMLVSTSGGQMQVREGPQGLVPESSIYRVTLSISELYQPVVPRVLRGQLVLFAQPKAYMSEFLRSAAALIVREAGL